MAKNKPVSKHSRAARRATSPSINTDKSLKDVVPPRRTTSSSDLRPSILAVHHSAGVQKKSKPVRKSRMSSKMRRRHEKGLEMAEAVTERTGKKIEKSIRSFQNVQKRSRTWEDINKEAVEGDEAEQVVGGSRFSALLASEGADGEKEWETDEEGDDGGFNPANPVVNKAADKDADDDDEIL